MAVAEAFRTHEISEEEILRARFYNLLSRLLAAPPSAETLEFLGRLEGDETAIGRALEAMSEAAGATTPKAADEEYNALFFGQGTGGELTPYASHYQTGFVYEKPL
ncbi:MAG: molecular chaperone TorD family protein, partial [Rhodospirillales bacterium]